MAKKADLDGKNTSGIWKKTSKERKQNRRTSKVRFSFQRYISNI